MKKLIIPAAAAAAVAAALVCCAVLLPSYSAKKGASVLRSPAYAQNIVSEAQPDNPRYMLVKSDGFEISSSAYGGSELLIYDYGGWADEPRTEIYSADGSVKKIRSYELDEYKSAGWSDEMPEREGMTELRDGIVSYISGISGEWGAYVKRMDTNEYLTVNEHKYSGASLIKLYTMAAVYNEAAAGSLAVTDDIRDSLTFMITESSNIDCNRLTEALGGGDTIAGFEVENRNTAAIGCQNTIHQSELVDGTGETIFVGFNQTSPADCARVLELIYKQKLVNPSASAEMLDLLKRQERTWKIPAALPDGTVTANKTGETDTVEADAAIVYSPACDYVICVIGNGSVGSGVEDIRTISKMTYDYLNR